MKLPPALERSIDIGGLIVALIVDIVMNVICFYILAPDLITSIAFVCIGVMTVLFVFRSWSKRQYAAWIIFVAVVFFFDYSFTLESTRAQSNTVTAATDPEIIRLQTKVDETDRNIVDLQRQYDEAAKRETMDQIDEQIKAERARNDRYEAERRARLADLETGTAGKTRITAEAIFQAIPAAWNDGRYIQLVIFGLIFVGLQLIVASSIDGKAQGVSVAVPLEPVTPPAPSAPAVAPPEPPAPPLDVTADQISQFVTLSWYRVDQKTSDHILPEDAFFDYMSKKNIQYDHKVYEYLFALCIKINIMNDDGFILIKTKNQAIDALEKGVRDV